MKLFIAAFVLSLIMTPIAIKLNIFDKPNYRKIHIKPVPKAGGIGIFGSTIILYSVLTVKNSALLNDKKFICIFVCTLILVITGLIDDKVELRPKSKITIQTILAVFSILAGIKFDIFHIYFIDCIISGVWIIGIINAVNLIDGLDGLASGIAVISFSGFFVLAYLTNSSFINIICLSAIGSNLGFLVFNFRPAKIFMGDTGSLPLGYTMAITGILIATNVRGETSFILSVIMLGIPIYDTALSIIRRYINHRPIFDPDRSHFYNLIMDLKNVEHKNTVLIIYAINIIISLVALMCFGFNGINRISILVLLISIAIYSSIRFDFIKIDKINSNINSGV